MAARVRALPLAIALAVLVLGAALVLRAFDLVAGRVPAGTALLPVLVSAAAVCLAALLRRRAPAAAWLATVAAAAIAAIEVVGVVRFSPGAADAGAWPWAVVLAEIAIVLAAAIAAAYASRRQPGAQRSRAIAWRLAVLAGLGVVLAVGAVTIGGAFAGTSPATVGTGAGVDVGPLRVSGRVAAGFIAVATLAGAWLDLVWPARRAWARAGGLAEFPRAFADELLPTSTASRRRGVEDERARLAAELHARVLPDLRRAAEAAESSGTPTDPVTMGLRHAVEDVEELMHARQSVVLEEYGLVAALEWLAERAQQRTAIEVDVELDGTAVDNPAGIPKPVARAAFRVALLALDNVVRHAGASRVVIRLTVEQDRVGLVIADDGRGIETVTRRHAGRGLLDMRTIATEVGGVIAVERAEPGTHVLFKWPAAEHPATAPAISTTGRSEAAG